MIILFIRTTSVCRNKVKCCFYDNCFRTNAIKSKHFYWYRCGKMTGNRKLSTSTATLKLPDLTNFTIVIIWVASSPSEHTPSEAPWQPGSHTETPHTLEYQETLLTGPTRLPLPYDSPTEAERRDRELKRVNTTCYKCVLSNSIK